VIRIRLPSGLVVEYVKAVEIVPGPLYPDEGHFWFLYDRDGHEVARVDRTSGLIVETQGATRVFDGTMTEGFKP